MREYLRPLLSFPERPGPFLELRFVDLTARVPFLKRLHGVVRSSLRGCRCRSGDRASQQVDDCSHDQQTDEWTEKRNQPPASRSAHL
ncbi:hypothetical protein HSEST_1262 [Halapricum desulfuricans]|uniref:Uncharacterized protein n=1 Tax=Halapricum desulfuricans TaxID=2841257 RepID=A0A897NTF0_9EURY|nr:hypothetical protein HSEST_1262 [Halapricum desulfuricans]